MLLTEKGKAIKKGDKVFYASKNAGKIKGVDKKKQNKHKKM